MLYQPWASDATRRAWSRCHDPSGRTWSKVVVLVLSERRHGLASNCGPMSVSGASLIRHPWRRTSMRRRRRPHTTSPSVSNMRTPPSKRTSPDHSLTTHPRAGASHSGEREMLHLLTPSPPLSWRPHRRTDRACSAARSAVLIVSRRTSSSRLTSSDRTDCPAPTISGRNVQRRPSVSNRTRSP